MRTILIILMIIIAPTLAFAGGSSTAGAIAGAEAEALSVSISPQQLPGTMPVYPYLLQQIPGQVGDITADKQMMFNIDGLLPLTNEKIVRAKDSVQVKYGWFMDRIRLEDIEQDLINFLERTIEKKGWKLEEIRYRVQYKQNQRAVGSGGGATGNITALNGGSSQYGGGGSMGMLPGWASTLADHHFILKLYRVAPPFSKVGELEYRQQGWTKVESKESSSVDN